MASASTRALYSSGGKFGSLRRLKGSGPVKIDCASVKSIAELFWWRSLCQGCTCASTLCCAPSSTDSGQAARTFDALRKSISLSSRVPMPLLKPSAISSDLTVDLREDRRRHHVTEVALSSIELRLSLIESLMGIIKTSCASASELFVSRKILSLSASILS